MAQKSKYIDVTRSFIPVDPEAFPQTLHTNGMEETPEERIPVIAYAGQNFLPTSYGYKSFFGINNKLDIDALGVRIDAIMIYQTVALVNVIVALTEEGIYYCDSMAGGTWTHAVDYDPPTNPETYLMWTWCTLNNELYFYQQGRSSFWRLYSTAEGVKVEEMEPGEFLNMEGQIGIFKAGSRLGFWDSANSCAWSSIDDFTDFKPSVTTLAGSTIFTEIVGSITTIQPHGDGFMIYATKSIVWIQKAESSLYQWSPKVVMSNAGIAYPRQAAVALPDTTHFVYTTQGLFKIQNTEAAVIIPEVWDHLKAFRDPKYLKFMQGRYLAIEMFQDISNSSVAFKDGVVPEEVLVLPGADGILADAIAESQLGRDPLCGVFKGFNDSLFTNQPPQPGGEPSSEGELPMAAPGDAHPTNPNYKPLYACHLRMPRFNSGTEIEWGYTPCPITDFHGGYLEVSPKSYFEEENTRVVLGTDAYTDGQWTIERFVSTQSALWGIEEAALERLLSEIEQRTEQDTLETHDGSPITPAPFDSSGCDGKVIPSKFTKPYFGMNRCSFWLTRYGVEAMQIRHLSREGGISEDTREVKEDPAMYIVGNVNYSAGSCDAAAALAAAASGHSFTPTTFDPNEGLNYAKFTKSGVDYAGYYVAAYRDDNGFGGVTTQLCAALVAPPGGTKSLVLPISGTFARPVAIQDTAGRYKSTQTKKAFNQLKPKEHPPIPETAYCEFVGWQYTAADGTRKTMTGGSCLLTGSDVGGSAGGEEGRQVPYENTDSLLGNLAPFSDDGQVCETPFAPIVIPGEPAVELDWPDQTITYPSGTFLLRDGTAAPLYPVAKGAYVYDTHLKKWGKMVQNYLHLIDYSPINSTSQSSITPETFGIMAGMVSSSGVIYLFDDFPKDSWITYGKLGYYRWGLTSLEEVRVDFNSLSTGKIKVEGSLEGKTYNIAIDKQESFENTRTHIMYGINPAKWHNITISGHYDISYLQYQGFIQGNR